MGAELSTGQSPAPPPPRVVLVPPFFQRDIRGLSRFCRSSYDYLGSRKQLGRLLRDHLSPELRGMLLLSPPDDPRVSVRAKLRPSGGSMLLRWQPASAASLHTFIEMAASLDSPGDVCLRGSYLHPNSGLGVFMVAPLAKDLSGEAAQVGVRYSSPDATAGAIFIPRHGELDKLWLAGRLHGWTLGLQLSPGLPVRRALAAIAAAAPLREPTAAPEVGGGGGGGGDQGGAGSSLAGLRAWLRRHASVLLSYSPPARSGAAAAPFTASVELAQGGALTFSFFQHVAATRQVVNPFEEDEVVGITNYLDIGLQLTTATVSSSSDSSPTAAAIPPLRPNLIRRVQPAAAGAGQSRSDLGDVGASSGGSAAAGADGGNGVHGGGGSSSMSGSQPAVGPIAVPSEAAAQPATIDLAASWQVNKNWLLKARVGSRGAAAAVGARVWHAVSAYLTASVAVEYATLSKPRYGVELCVENFGPLQYERGADDVVAGRALLQRHEASQQDLDNFTGRGLLVRRSTKAGDQSSGGGPDGGRQHQEERRRVAQLM